MSQSKANQWIHVLVPALQAALHTLGDTPAAPSRLSRNGWCLGGGGDDRGRAAGGGAPTRSPHTLCTSRRAGLPPFSHDGTELKDLGFLAFTP